MLGNLLKIAVRNLFRQKVYSIINILGLATGIACSLLIYLWVQYELSFDKFHQHPESLFTVYENQYYAQGDVFSVYSTPGPLAASLKKEYPEVEMATRYMNPWGKLTMQAGDQIFAEEQLRMVDPDFFSMFSFPVFLGDSENPLKDSRSLVLTRRMAEKYFGKENPIGHVVVINTQYSFRVNAVVENPPANSQLQFDFLAPYSLFAELMKYDPSNWDSHYFLTFLKLKEGIGQNEFEPKIRYYLKQHVENSPIELRLQKFTRMHLNSISSESGGLIRNVRIFSLVALLILVIACFNFMNLATARSEKRAREVGIRKVVGAPRRSLILQFLGESMCLTLVAFVVATVFVELFLPVFNHLTERDLELNLGDVNLLTGMVGIILLTGFLAGSYPAFFLSSFMPVRVLRGMPRQESAFLRKFLVVIQFAMSVGLIICTTLIYQQLYYLKNKDVGYNRKNVVYFEIMDDFNGYYPAFKEEVQKIPGVMWVTAAGQMPVNITHSTSDVSWPEKAPDLNVRFQLCYADYDFVETFEMEMTQGRSFSSALGNDSLSFIINEEAARRMGMVNPLNESLTLWDYKGKVIGVVKDFNYSGLHVGIDPIILFRNPSAFRFVAMRLKGDDMASTLMKIQKVWQRILPNQPFAQNFLEDDFDRLYTIEKRMARVFNYFTILAIIISCLGLFGLASFVAEKRTKEMGVRKVMGASLENIFGLLVIQFLKWVLLANAIAWPIAYMLMSQWLRNFAYHIPISWRTFAVSGIVSLIIALITVIYQAIRVAVANPVNAIKYE